MISCLVDIPVFLFVIFDCLWFFNIDVHSCYTDDVNMRTTGYTHHTDPETQLQSSRAAVAPPCVKTCILAATDGVYLPFPAIVCIGTIHSSSVVLLVYHRDSRLVGCTRLLAGDRSRIQADSAVLCFGYGL